jgi:hypothetical protein
MFNGGDEPPHTDGGCGYSKSLRTDDKGWSSDFQFAWKAKNSSLYTKMSIKNDMFWDLICFMMVSPFLNMKKYASPKHGLFYPDMLDDAAPHSCRCENLKCQFLTVRTPDDVLPVTIQVDTNILGLGL